MLSPGKSVKQTGLNLISALLTLFLVACATSPPGNIRDACNIFEDKSGWYGDAKHAYKKWGIPIEVQLAIIHQESRFHHDAKPPRTRLLWVIPWTRSSSAYGYGQAKDATWAWYQRDTGNRWADRDDFADVTDFIGWYGNMSHNRLGISKSDAYSQYLAYHEGHGGYRRKSYSRKKWLLRVAAQVNRNARRYRNQLRHCRKKLDRGLSWWPFG